jgi:hypothetical protein
LQTLQGAGLGPLFALLVKSKKDKAAIAATAQKTPGVTEVDNQLRIAGSASL